jgi:hypothetical protein
LPLITHHNDSGLAYLMGNKKAAVACAMDGVGSLLFGNKTNEAARKRTEMENQSPADVIQIGGCRDDQTSADARINGGRLAWLHFHPGLGFGALSSTCLFIVHSLTQQDPRQSIDQHVHHVTTPRRRPSERRAVVVLDPGAEPEPAPAVRAAAQEHAHAAPGQVYAGAADLELAPD